MCAESASHNRLVSVIYTVLSCLAESNSEYKGHSQERSKKESVVMASSFRLYVLIVLSIFLPSGAFAAEKSTAPQLIELAKSPGPALREAIMATFEAKDLQEGSAWAGHGP